MEAVKRGPVRRLRGNCSTGPFCSIIGSTSLSHWLISTWTRCACGGADGSDSERAKWRRVNPERKEILEAHLKELAVAPKRAVSTTRDLGHVKPARHHVDKKLFVRGTSARAAQRDEHRSWAPPIASSAPTCGPSATLTEIPTRCD